MSSEHQRNKEVFLPGLSYKGELWDGVIQNLDSEGNITFKLDLPDYGSDYKGVRLDFNTLPAYIRDQLRELEVPPPFYLIGHSLGGLIALKYANIFPNDIEGLVLVSTPLRKPESEVPLSYKIATSVAAKFPIDNTLRKVFGWDSRLIESLKSRIEGRGFVNPEFLSYANASSIAYCLQELYIYDFRSDIKSINEREKPTLIVYGSKDKPLLAIGGTDLYPEFNEANILNVDDNHSIPVNKPSDLAEIIVKFINSCREKIY